MIPTRLRVVRALDQDQVTGQNACFNHGIRGDPSQRRGVLGMPQMVLETHGVREFFFCWREIARNDGAELGNLVRRVGREASQ